MDEVEEERLPHVVLAGAPEDSDVRRSNVLCSKIIRDRSNRNVRFRRSALFLKIVHFNDPGIVAPSSTGEYPRPLRSPFPCFNCHRTFTCPPKFMPIVMLDGSRTEDGNYCSGPCMMSYAHANLVNSNLAGLAADIFCYMQDVHGFRGNSVGLAPSFRQRQLYGGELTDDQFDVVVGNPCLTTHIRMKPFIPTDVVIEWQFAGETSNATSSASASASGLVSQDDGVAVLNAIMDTKVPEVDHHHRWEVRGLRQPPLEVIESRLASLPQLEKRKGLYEIYLERRGGFDASVDPVSTASALTTAKTTTTDGQKRRVIKPSSSSAGGKSASVDAALETSNQPTSNALTSLLTPACAKPAAKRQRVSQAAKPKPPPEQPV
jgi:hypothetical protein